MLLTVYNKFFKRINILRKYEFAQYTDRFRDIGDFQIYAVLCEENMYFFDKDNIYYISFGTEFFGRVEDVKKDADSDYSKTITIIGRAISFILDKRIVYKQQNFSGTPEQMLKKIMDDNIRVEGPRFLNIVTSYQSTYNLSKETVDESLQQTGGSVFSIMQSIMESNHMGYDLKPKIEKLHFLPGTAEETNISQFDFTILRGEDRRFGNQAGNQPVVFSQSYNNLRRSIYERDIMSVNNVAYVAGEGEGIERTWLEVLGDQIKNPSDYDSSGWYRYEMYVDARDLQSETEQGTLTAAEYEKLLKTRGLSSLSLYREVENYEATVIQNENRYVYGKDFYKGDYVTIRDNEIGLDVGAQITEVTVSVEKSKETFDIMFGNKTITVTEKLRKEGVI